MFNWYQSWKYFTNVEYKNCVVKLVIYEVYGFINCNADTE